MKSDGLYDKYRLQYDNEDIADTLQHIALRAGYTSLKYTKVTKPSFLGKDNTKPNISNYIKLRKMNGVEYKEKVEIDYDDKVWCPSTELGTVIFRDENKSVFISGNSQSPFSNITLDIKVPKDLKKKHPVLGGEKMKFTYSDCQDAMDIFNIELFKIFEQGDSAGNIFQYPIPTINITKDFDWESPVVKQIMKVTAKYGIPYFSNYINSDMSPDDVRSMCTTEDSKIRIRTKENWVRITHDDGRMEYKKETDI
jgi:ribonucleoside-triphosphate reductase